MGRPYPPPDVIAAAYAVPPVGEPRVGRDERVIPAGDGGNEPSIEEVGIERRRRRRRRHHRRLEEKEEEDHFTAIGRLVGNRVGLDF